MKIFVRIRIIKLGYRQEVFALLVKKNTFIRASRLWAGWHQSPWHKTSIPVHIGLARYTQQQARWRWWGWNQMALQNPTYFQILTCGSQIWEYGLPLWFVKGGSLPLVFSAAAGKCLDIKHLDILGLEKIHFDVSFRAGSNSYTTWKITTWKEAAAFEYVCV